MLSRADSMQPRSLARMLALLGERELRRRERAADGIQSNGDARGAEEQAADPNLSAGSGEARHD